MPHAPDSSLFPPAHGSPTAPLDLETVPAQPYINFPFTFVARPLPAAAHPDPAGRAACSGPSPAATAQGPELLKPRMEPSAAVPPLPILSRCWVRIFRARDEGQPNRFTVLITELPQGDRSDRFANPGRPAIDCLADLLPEINRTYLLKVPDQQITWFFHRRGVVSPTRPIRHDDVYRLSSLGPIGGCHMPVLIDAAIDEFEAEAGGLVEL